MLALPIPHANEQNRAKILQTYRLTMNKMSVMCSERLMIVLDSLSRHFYNLEWIKLLAKIN